MPKSVDHAVRRQEILSAAISVIEAVGLDRTTTRLIAGEAGYSQGVLAHYFLDKDEILRAALEFTHHRARARRAALLSGRDPAAALELFLFENLPLDEERRTETLLEMSFWPRAASSPQLSEFQRTEATRLLDELTGLIERVRAQRPALREASAEELAELLIGEIDGLSVHAMLFPDRLPRERLEALMREQLRALGLA